MKRIHIIGRKNSGKTTLICDVVEEMTRQGFCVGTIKHTHHDHELDAPGKDSHRHREAGSAAVGILTRGMNAIFWPQDRSQDLGKYDHFDALMKECDLVLVEGDSQTTSPKIEVFRGSNENKAEPLAAEDDSIVAVISHDELDVTQPTWKRSDINSIVANLVSQFGIQNSSQ